MDNSFGKIIMVAQGVPDQEFELNKSSITIGRANTNDIILNDGRVSRNHARLECGSEGIRIIDLGSSNGTRLNGKRIDQAELTASDTFELGSTQLRYQPAVVEVEHDLGMTLIDNELELDQTIDHEILPYAINETSVPHLVVITQEKTWEVLLGDVESLTIGRSDENNLVLEIAKVSRKHAEIVRRGGIFVLRDLGSTNGTWHKGEKVQEMILQNGDSFDIGEVQLVYKSGFQEESLTIADESLLKTTSRQIVIFVPGTMGSELWIGQERIWPNVKLLFKHPDLFRYPSKEPVEARGILNEVVIVPNLIKLDQYNRLGDYLVEELGYQRGVTFFEFPYDWRQDVRISARQLGQLVESLPSNIPITIIAHSLGTMVSRYYLECLGGKKRIHRVVLMGGPHKGAVKGLTSMLIAPQVLPFGLMGEKMRQVIMTFPSCYQILPTYACGTDQYGNKINFLEDESWIPEENLPLLKMGQDFRREIGNKVSISAIAIYGYGIKTISSVNVFRTSSGKFKDINYIMTPAGDSTILEHSAVMPGTEIHPVQQYHGSLFVDKDVKMRLKLELTKPF